MQATSHMWHQYPHTLHVKDIIPPYGQCILCGVKSNNGQFHYSTYGLLAYSRSAVAATKSGCYILFKLCSFSLDCIYLWMMAMHVCSSITWSSILTEIHAHTRAELEIAACHLPFSEQNMNMADLYWAGSAIWLTTKTESWVSDIGYYSWLPICSANLKVQC
jgi:hypothetical protein